MAQISSSAAAAKAAMLEISIAAAVIPAAWPIAQLVYFNQCDPEQLFEVAKEWSALSDQLDSARQGLDNAVSTVTAAQWSGADRDAFGGHVQAYDVQVVGSQVVAVTVSVVLIAVGLVLFILVMVYTVVSTILLAFATFIAASAATGIGAPAAASAEATATSFATSALVELETIVAAADSLGVMGAAAIGGALSFDVGVQLGSGNTDVLKDLVKATFDGLDNVAAGFLSKAERDFAGHGIYNGGKHVAGSPFGPGSLIYGGMTQYAPSGTDKDGDPTFGTGGAVDNLWKGLFGEDAWNH
ncbi:hypothetical protein AB0C02_05830 [Micromonospora sp. NPDC048999]|uniref:WXG100 family type VII secretion target n=1 Tax=Micromonospora sp. NPDC048999 TaxID=3155391 RepID=UPI0033C24B2E